MRFRQLSPNTSHESKTSNWDSGNFTQKYFRMKLAAMNISMKKNISYSGTLGALNNHPLIPVTRLTQTDIVQEMPHPLSWRMLLPLKSEGLGQDNTNSQDVWKSCHYIRLLTKQIHLKKIVFKILLIMGVALSQCSFSKFRLHAMKKLCIVFLFSSAQKLCLKFLTFYFKLEIFLSFLVSTLPNKK